MARKIVIRTIFDQKFWPVPRVHIMCTNDRIVLVMAYEYTGVTTATIMNCFRAVLYWVQDYLMIHQYFMICACCW